MRHEQQAWRILQRSATRQVNDQVAGFSWQGNGVIRLVKANMAASNACFLECRDDLGPDCPFLARDTWHSQKPHETLGCLALVDGCHGCLRTCT
jgi:hypothetical protein